MTTEFRQFIITEPPNSEELRKRIGDAYANSEEFQITVREVRDVPAAKDVTLTLRTELAMDGDGTKGSVLAEVVAGGAEEHIGSIAIAYALDPSTKATAVVP